MPFGAHRCRAIGFARARSGQCGHDFLIAFSCKGRGVCPSCNTRHMVEIAAHLTDHVLPRLPVRQWVLVVPKRLRYFLHRDADLQGAALRVFLRVVEQCLRAHNSGAGISARLGAVAFSHRFGSTLNPHLHFHCVVIDGVFEPAPAGAVVFREATGLNAQAFADVGAREQPLPGIYRTRGDLRPPHFPVGPVASSRDSLPQQASRGVGFPTLESARRAIVYNEYNYFTDVSLRDSSVRSIVSKSMWILLAALCAAAPASAEIFKCVAKDGGDLYQNFPCQFDSLGSLPSSPQAAKTTLVPSDARQARPKAVEIASTSKSTNANEPRIGMTTEEVRGIWGEPVETEEDELREGRIEIWRYADSRSVQFNNKHRVSAVQR